MNEKETKIYPKGIVYIIRTKKSDDVYIGSTIQTLKKRLSEHVTIYKRFRDGKTKSCVRSCLVIHQGDYYIEQIEEYDNITLAELRKHEGEFTLKTKGCVNVCIAGRTAEDIKNGKLREY